MANSNGNGARNPYAAVFATLGLLAAIVGGAMAFHGSILRDVQAMAYAELKHTVTRSELAELRRAESEANNQRHSQILQRLDKIETQIEELKRNR